jgi:hypothetical protein
VDLSGGGGTQGQGQAGTQASEVAKGQSLLGSTRVRQSENVRRTCDAA